MSRIFNILQAITYGIISLYGEHLQDEARGSVENYSWISGHLSDIFLVAQSVALGQMIAGKNKAMQYITALAPPIACTLHELEVVNLSPGATTYDPQDIVCYWGGAALAFGLSKLVANKSTKKLNTTIEDKLESKPP
jgi:hypothetical protein